MSVFVFDKNQLKYIKEDRDAILETLKRGVIQLTKIRHPRVLTVCRVHLTTISLLISFRSNVLLIDIMSKNMECVIYLIGSAPVRGES